MMRSVRSVLFVLVLALLALPACASYTGELEGDHIKVQVGTSPLSFDLSGQNMTGDVKKDGVVFAALPTKVSGHVTWTKETGWQVNRDAAPAPVALDRSGSSGIDGMVYLVRMKDDPGLVKLDAAPRPTWGFGLPRDEGRGGGPVAPPVYASP